MDFSPSWQISLLFFLPLRLSKKSRNIISLVEPCSVHVTSSILLQGKALTVFFFHKEGYIVFADDQIFEVACSNLCWQLSLFLWARSFQVLISFFASSFEDKPAFLRDDLHYLSPMNSALANVFYKKNRQFSLCQPF